MGWTYRRTQRICIGHIMIEQSRRVVARARGQGPCVITSSLHAGDKQGDMDAITTERNKKREKNLNGINHTFSVYFRCGLIV